MTEHNKNIVMPHAHIDAEGNVIVGDGNNITVTHLKEAAQYKALQVQLNQLEKRFDITMARIERFSEDEEFKVELLQISEERNKKQQEINTLTNQVLKLAEEFSSRPINTQRLRFAKQYFDTGEFDKARTELDPEQMSNELNEAIRKEELGKQLQEQGKEERANLANEFVMLAGLTAFNFKLANRFEITNHYFEQALKADRNPKNVFAYAYFLQEHNQYSQAQPLYEDALALYQILAQADPLFLPNLALTLNNLANLLLVQRDFNQANSYLKKALKIRGDLAQVNPQAYLPDVAQTLLNLANAQKLNNEPGEAKPLYEEALQIRRSLAQANPNAYLSKVAMTLNNLAALLVDLQDFTQAKLFYDEVLAIYQTLANVNPNDYLPNIAMTLNNQATLLAKQQKITQAKPLYEEALQIRKSLAQTNPYTYLPDLAMTLSNLALLLVKLQDYTQAKLYYEEVLAIYKTLAKINPKAFMPNVILTTNNMSIFYQKSIPNKTKSLDYAAEAILNCLTFTAFLPDAEQYIKKAQQLVNDWGEDIPAFMQKIHNELDHENI